MSQPLLHSIAVSAWEALCEGELARAEHQCRALMRSDRERITKMLNDCRVQAVDNPCLVRNGAYLSNEYLVTAIVSTYKGERFMEGRLIDLLSQSIADRLEILVIDSASPEREGEIVASYQQRHTNIRYLRTTRRESIYQAWNRGVTTARGRYLTNANTDDRLSNNAMERLVAELEWESADVAYADALITTAGNESFQKNSSLQATRRPSFSFNALLQSCITGSQPVWRKALHESVGLFDVGYSSAGDYDFFIRAAQCCRFIHIPEPLGLVWTSPETYSGKGILPLLEFYEIRERYRHLLIPADHGAASASVQEGIWETVRKQLPGLRDDEMAELIGDNPFLNYRIGLFHEEAGDNGSAWRYLQRAFYLAPGYPGYREALERSLATNLHAAVRTTVCREIGQATFDLLQSIALAMKMLGYLHTAAWLYVLALQQEPESAVCLVNLEKTVTLLSEGESR